MNSTDTQLHSLLIDQCRIDQQQRQEGSNACLTLFNKALVEGDNIAWNAINNQFQTLVTYWVSCHSRFEQTGEDAVVFVNAAFIRLWKYGAPRAKENNFRHLGDYLAYLKRCTWSAVEDYLRKLKRDAIWHQTQFDDIDIAMEQQEDEQNATLAELFNIIWELTAENPQERVMAEETWVYGLPPRQIQEKHPDLFTDIGAVNKSKRNLLRRLRRHPKIKHLVDLMDQKVI